MSPLHFAFTVDLFPEGSARGRGGERGGTRRHKPQRWFALAKGHKTSLTQVFLE